MFLPLHRLNANPVLASLLGWVLLAGCPSEPTVVDGSAVPIFDATIVDDQGAIICVTDEDCYAMGASPCRSAECGSDKVCVWRPSSDGTPCSTGNACVVGQTCSDGNCQGGAPKPPCTNLSCGFDACGNACGSCDPGFGCEQGVCSPVLCQGIEWQGCCTATGTVRWCDDGELLEVACPEGEASDRQACGWDISKGHYDCGADGPSDPGGTYPYLCPGENCPPEPCGDKQCGFACGQSCGECPADASCDNGVCVVSPPESDVLESDSLTQDAQSGDSIADSNGPSSDSGPEDTESADAETGLKDTSDTNDNDEPIDSDALAEPPTDGKDGSIDASDTTENGGAAG